MGSYAEGLHPQDEEITVYVTGFAPFRDQNPVNPSWEIARALPPFLPPSKPSPTPEVSQLAAPPRVRILVHPEPVHVAYTTVRPLVPKLWEGRKIDYMVHIGMATSRQFYCVERRGHRDGYVMKDVDGELLGDEERKERGEKCEWDNMPEEILSGLNIEDIWKKWRVALPNTDVRVSEDAGHYLCDFIYYSSLSYLEMKGEEKRVVFLHVPIDVDEAAVKTGVEATIELIRAMIQSDGQKKLSAGQ
ncbi:Pyroglutamyl aminopeptidase I [Hyphodiscus hymeniophilus]|uniref:Pyroglutamyl aminopeptidase I n=1 Tax=Hyphodiscus hymeniophilus TaxID=353542 RepID=A0A9P7AZ52_9HELO|nr:Pyroglutamyl aminopeptidase I [Hyphodiscus hymeniophilus]